MNEVSTRDELIIGAATPTPTPTDKDLAAAIASTGLSAVPPELLEDLLKSAVTTLWTRGSLEYKLHATQLKILEALDAATGRQFFLLCSRRLGKTFLLVLMCFQVALRKPGARVLFLAPWAKDAANIARDTAAKLMADMPAHLQPEFKTQSHEFYFKNGSILRMAGVNGQTADYHRGGEADLIVLDECGIMDDLESVLKDVCLPMTLTTGGRIFLATTPPKTPSHASAAIYERLAGKNAAVKFTLLDAPHIDHQTKAEMLLEIGEDPNKIEDVLAGKTMPETTTGLREYWCEFVTDADSAVIPEFRRAKTKIVREHVRPAHFDAYTFMDPGFKDRTGLLFGYLDFLNGVFVFEDEALLHHATTEEIAQTIRTKETELWDLQQPYLRITDIDLRLIADLWQLHRIRFQKARKEDSQGAINLLRTGVQNERIIISPRCKGLIRQMENAVWNTTGKDFERPEDSRSVDGHFDLVAAAKYGYRALNWTRNPYPAGWFAVGGPAGPAAGSWTSPKSRAQRKQGLFGDTPTTRRLLKHKPRLPR